MGISQSGPEGSIGPISRTGDGFSVGRPDSDDDWRDYFDLRWRLLREPHGQPRGSERDEYEDQADHLLARLDDGQAVGVARLHRAMPGQGQVRYLAVDENCRRKGIGLKMLRLCDRLARGRGYRTVVAEVRNPVRSFYRRRGYHLGNPGKTLFGTLRHTWMHKSIHVEDFSGFGLLRRSAGATDLAGVESLIFKVLDEYGLSLEPDGIDADMTSFPDYYLDGMFDVLLAGDTVVGTVALRHIDESHCELRRMYLDPAYRGRGVGRACLGYALASARQRGYSEMQLETATVLSEALGLYRWAGFAEISGKREATRCDRLMTLTL